MDKTQILKSYLPEPAAPLIARWIDYFQCEFKISKSRKSKLGDYRHPYADKGHRISVNANLNAYAFLITTVHEFAHLLTYNEYKNSVSPHGGEWKANFQRMMKPFFELQLFPADILQAIRQYMQNPKASSCSDLALIRVLKRYDPIKDSRFLEQLPHNISFMLADGRVFIKGEKLRKRYKCLCLKTQQHYLFSPIAEVYMIANKNPSTESVKG